jgi:hypothetical protein
MRDAIIDELATLNPSMFVSKWILERVPHVFAEDYSSFIQWRATLAAGIGVDPCAIVLTGSEGVRLVVEK